MSMEDELVYYNYPKQRNVLDKFQSLTEDEIKTSLRSTAFPVSILLCHLESDLNFSNIIRTCNIFNVSKVYYYGKKKWDRRGSVGLQNYMDITHISDLGEFKSLSQSYYTIAVDIGIGATSIDTIKTYPANPLFIFGQEKSGIPAELLDLCQSRVYVEQYGAGRSLNVATAAGIVIHDWVSKFKR